MKKRNNIYKGLIEIAIILLFVVMLILIAKQNKKKRIENIDKNDLYSDISNDELDNNDENEIMELSQKDYNFVKNNMKNIKCEDLLSNDGNLYVKVHSENTYSNVKVYITYYVENDDVIYMNDSRIMLLEKNKDILLDLGKKPENSKKHVITFIPDKNNEYKSISDKIDVNLDEKNKEIVLKNNSNYDCNHLDGYVILYNSDNAIIDTIRFSDYKLKKGKEDFKSYYLDFEKIQDYHHYEINLTSAYVDVSDYEEWIR